MNAHCRHSLQVTYSDSQRLRCSNRQVLTIDKCTGQSSQAEDNTCMKIVAAGCKLAQSAGMYNFPP
jgi:hypothetical protein